MVKVEMISTTNKNFKYMQGKVIAESDFKVGTVVWFGNFHTSNVHNIKYTYMDGEVRLIVTTLNSLYEFSILLKDAA